MDKMIDKQLKGFVDAPPQALSKTWGRLVHLYLRERCSAEAPESPLLD